MVASVIKLVDPNTRVASFLGVEFFTASGAIVSATSSKSGRTSEVEPISRGQGNNRFKDVLR